MTVTVTRYDHPRGPGAIIKTATGAVFIPAHQLTHIAEQLQGINTDIDNENMA